MAASLSAVDTWPYLDQEVLLRTRSPKVCMTCHWFCHHSEANGIPLLTCQLHRGLIAHGEHLTSRCQGWSDARDTPHLANSLILGTLTGRSPSWRRTS